MALTQAGIDTITARLAATNANNATAASRLNALLALFATNHPTLDLTALQAQIQLIDPANQFWVEQQIRRFAASG